MGGGGTGSAIFTTVPGAVAFWLTVLAFVAMDLALATRGLTGRIAGSEPGRTRPGRAGGLRLLVIAEVVGLAIAWVGILVRFSAKKTLGRFFVAALVVQDGHHVVTRGPYAVVRHPGYAGMMLVLLGLALASANVATIVILVAVPLVIILRAIPSEEALLEQALGREYTRYSTRTARLIPRVW